MLSCSIPASYSFGLTQALRRCKQLGVRPSRFFLVVSIAKQTLSVFERSTVGTCNAPGVYALSRQFRCSTSKFGIGEKAGSNKTPRGLHRITEKIGGGWPVGAAFKSRQLIGYTWNGRPMASITNRILWLDGQEPGFNRGGDVDSHSRFIYIHGTGDEPSLGRPASHGCVQLGGDELIPLYDTLPVGTLVWITER